jgi:Protein of unknown function (DUF551)
MMDWQPIATAPKDGTAVLLAITPIDSYDLLGYRPDRHVTRTIGWWDGDEWDSDLMEEGTADTEGFSSAIPIHIRPTHWMPLPAPPSAELPPLPGYTAPLST